MLQRRYSDGVVLGVGVGVVDALPAPVPVGVAACCVTDAVSDALGVSDAPAPRERHERLPMGDALGCGDARGVAVGDGDGATACPSTSARASPSASRSAWARASRLCLHVDVLVRDALGGDVV